MRKETPSYLLKENLEKVMRGDNIRAVMKLRCGNSEDANKCWLKDKEKRCRFCKMGRDILELYRKL